MVLTMMMALLTIVGTSSVTNAADIERVDATSWFPPYSEIIHTDSI